MRKEERGGGYGGQGGQWSLALKEVKLEGPRDSDQSSQALRWTWSFPSRRRPPLPIPWGPNPLTAQFSCG